ncbi:K+-dependent Na+/Ca+ exchanger [Robertmurraya siralis]|uniref:K+-dependent Na+/Ca+ exchanger n=1 Tax=Robertmurraya siralis TaxID=77777 RepID=A0A919WL92_9BACI|nr:K+-dependent Na+/Ca+ exchanger [Robertmurraya siralis]
MEGSSNIAALLKIAPMIIGLTIVSFGTSSPEAAVSITAALNGNAGVTLGNVVGSNIFNITLVIGISAFLNPLKVESDTIRKEIPFTLLASVALFIMISDISLQFFDANSLTRGDGLILLLFFAIFMYYVIEIALNSREQGLHEESNKKTGSWGKNIVFTIGGLAGIILGGNIVVDSSTTIAYSLGMSETLVGLTIVAIGTSLPELITSVTASYKKLSEIALGNIVGSNIFNILFVLGASSAISPLPVDGKLFTDVILMIGLTILLFIFSRSNYRIGKIEGVIMALTYVAYMVFIIMRN